MSKMKPLNDEETLATMPEAEREFMQDVLAMLGEGQRELLERLIKEFSANQPKPDKIRG